MFDIPDYSAINVLNNISSSEYAFAVVFLGAFFAFTLTMSVALTGLRMGARKGILMAFGVPLFVCLYVSAFVYSGLMIQQTVNHQEFEKMFKVKVVSKPWAINFDNSNTYDLRKKVVEFPNGDQVALELIAVKDSDNTFSYHYLNKGNSIVKADRHTDFRDLSK